MTPLQLPKTQFHWLVYVAMWACAWSVNAQKRPDDDAVAPPARTVIIKVPTPSTDAQLADLILQTAAMTKGAQVTLAAATGGKVFNPKQTDQKGSCRFEKLAPGKYTYRITHPDFNPWTESITLEKGKIASLMVELVSRYGTVAIGLGDKASEGAVVKVDDAVPPPEHYKIENGIILLTRIPVGKHKFSVEKPPAYVPWEEVYEVRPGANLLARTMAAATIKLRVQSEPGAEVFLADEKRGLVGQNGWAEIANLLPGPLQVRVIKPGYHEALHKLELTLDNRAPVLAAPLESVLDDRDFQDSWAAKDYWPRVPAGWEWREILPKGRVIKGDEVALVNNTSKANHQFNTLGDFRMQLTVRFQVAHGAAWVVRAKNLTEYYLFELDRVKAELRLYHCRNSRCDDPVETQKVVAELSDATKSYTITLEARGSKFAHHINTPKGEERLGGIFTHEALAYGGVGLRAIHGLEMLAQDFFVSPLKQPLK